MCVGLSALSLSFIQVSGKGDSKAGPQASTAWAFSPEFKFFANITSQQENKARSSGHPLSFFLYFRRPNLIIGLSGGQAPD